MNLDPLDTALVLIGIVFLVVAGIGSLRRPRGHR